MKLKEDFFTSKTNELGVTLNEVQKKAVLLTEGPLLLLASPGSGKTTTIIMRIGYLIEEKGVNPTRIKAVTFSRASANDMKERFKRFFPHLPPVDFSTIHSYAFEVVRNHFRRTGTSYQIIEGDLEKGEQETFDSSELPLHKRIILRHLFHSLVGETITDDQMEELTTYISFIKNKMIPPDRWSTIKTEVPQAVNILQAYEEYKRSGHRKLLIDYDDMLTIAEQALAGDRELLRRDQGRFDYVLTDESQDTSLVQHAIIEKLVREHRNLCVVADDDQSIYSWRGAEPSYLLNFRQAYPDAAVLYMEQNYRSSREIVVAANQFIKRNKQRYGKNMFTHNPPDQPIKLKSFADYVYQAKYLVREIQKLEQLSEAAVLYRNHSSSIALLNEFDRAGIPFYLKDADNRFFSHWVVEDILNFMRITFTDKRPELVEKIHLKMNGYLSKQQMAAVKGIDNKESVFDNLLNYVPLQDYQIKQLQACKETFREMNGMPPRHAIRVIRSRLGYEKALEKICERLGFRKEYLIGILNTLEEIADTLPTMEDFADRLKHLEAAVKTARGRKGQNAVTLSTFHSSKGLEFQRVYMIDLVDGTVPSSDDKGSADLMEEATRLFYVGMTRARKHLELIGYRKRDGKEVKESVFVTEVRDLVYPPKPNPIPSSVGSDLSANGKMAGSRNVTKAQIPHNPNAIRKREELGPGMAVKHRVFGRGTIVQLNDEQIHIQFGKSVKTLAVAICLEKGLLEPDGDREGLQFPEGF
ncbi:ATP-dependent helicase [Paenibacillus aurantius]|uniref:DNA 3'-5' helicase n=1 Tax=Paenibacillus aurantius TaxID=2918900 RepID=A0AA96LI36_9BACL|nr:ATP-dependent helicase [Paenibacillus aurantius]WNQ12530.1 ATP-dependent helicase [Paenibacillus aurantius]